LFYPQRAKIIYSSQKDLASETTFGSVLRNISLLYLYKVVLRQKACNKKSD